jgi:hypothetical protein
MSRSIPTPLYPTLTPATAATERRLRRKIKPAKLPMSRLLMMVTMMMMMVMVNS